MKPAMMGEQGKLRKQGARRKLGNVARRLRPTRSVHKVIRDIMDEKEAGESATRG
jgi:hypothetical protein